MQCQHFGVCGGCSLPGMPYQEQLRRKREHLADLLKMPVPALLPSPTEDRFRQKVAFVLGPDSSGSRLIMGHYEPSSRNIVPVVECPVHSDRGNRLAFALRDELVRARVPPLLLRHILVRTTLSGDEAVMMLVVWKNDKLLRAPIRTFLALPGAPTGFFVNVHDRQDAFIVGRETIRIAGRSHARENAIGPAFLISSSAFFQTNVGAAKDLVRLVVTGVGTSTRVLDLYSGSGLFALPLAAGGATVVAVEENWQATADAAKNLRVNGIPESRVTLIGARVEDAVGRLAREDFDAVVLDPPRQGCAPVVLSTITDAIRPARIVYVSCNPTVLALDLPRLVAARYKVERVQAVDMFPHTTHIETVVVLKRR